MRSLVNKDTGNVEEVNNNELDVEVASVCVKVKKDKNLNRT
jgi:hypothetical protein